MQDGSIVGLRLVALSEPSCSGIIRPNGLRSAVTLIAAGLGVAIALAVDLANATAVASFSIER